MSRTHSTAGRAAQPSLTVLVTDEIRRTMGLVSMTITGLSETTGLARTTLRRIAKGVKSPTLDQVELLAQALGTTGSDLVIAALARTAK